jgi:PHD/YefM family antitoxin component YafN of YafNO toxin-antitoxin module
MNITRDIDSLTNFKRNTPKAMEQLKASGDPLVLTINGRAELVVQDAAAYQAMLDAKDRAEAIAGIRRGLESMQRGDSIPARQAIESLRRKHKTGRK